MGSGSGSAGEEEAVRAERARQVALFRYRLIRDAADRAVSPAQRGRMVRELAAVEHDGPFGSPVRVSRASLDRWIRAWRAGGFEALLPPVRQVGPRTDAEVLELAVGLRRENADRTAAQIVRILRAQIGWSPSERTLQRHFVRLDLPVAGRGSAQVFGRFEADRPNELWTGDALHGPVVAGRKTYLFCFIDDHSRLVVGSRFGYAEDTVRLAAALRPALAARGVPEGVYVDNGSAFVDAWLLRACAVLGARLIHSAPGRPQGRGKIERFFGTVRDQFLVEIADVDAEPGSGHRVGDLQELNRLFTAWLETVYHVRVHTETGQSPLQRWENGWTVQNSTPRVADPDLLQEAFSWSEYRTVRKTCTVSLFGNTYRVEPHLTGRKVELVFDPFDLTDIDVRYHQNPEGKAIPHLIGRHSHPKAKPEQPDQAPATGIDYLALIDHQHDTTLAQAAINYADIHTSDDTDQLPGQITIEQAIAQAERENHTS